MRVLFHVDTGRIEGLGHLRECLSVADALRSMGIVAEFAVPQEPKFAYQEVAAQNYPVHRLPATDWQKNKADKIGALASTQSTGVVANLFHCNQAYAQKLNVSATTWATITEHKAEELAPLNFNICQNPELMPIDKLWQNSTPRNSPQPTDNVLICFGGSDPKNCTGIVLEFLRQGLERGIVLEKFCVHVVIGPLFEHGEAIKGLAKSFPCPIKLHGPLLPKDLCELAKSMDFSVTTGGGTMYEFCAIGLPCMVVPILDKMAANAAPLAKQGAIIATDRIDFVSADSFLRSFNNLVGADLRNKLSRIGPQVIDGSGAKRIASRLVKEWRLI